MFKLHPNEEIYILTERTVENERCQRSVAGWTICSSIVGSMERISERNNVSSKIAIRRLTDGACMHSDFFFSLSLSLPFAWNID